MSDTEKRTDAFARVAAMALVAAAYGFLLFFSFGPALAYASIFDQLQMNDRLPLPTVALLALGGLVRGWWWLLLGAVAGLEALLLRGRLDRAAPVIAILAGCAIGLLALGWVVGLRLPIAEIEHRLRQ